MGEEEGGGEGMVGRGGDERLKGRGGEEERKEGRKRREKRTFKQKKWNLKGEQGVREAHRLLVK